MRPNLWVYSTTEEINRTAGSLIVFGAEVFHKAKIIKDIDLLENIINKLNNKEILPSTKELTEFSFSYLTDTINILIFFENYMKAELMVRGFCVHKINRNIEEFKAIGKKQFKEPILLKDINEIESFESNSDRKEIFHRGIKETTIGMKELISEKYLVHYEINEEILKLIEELRIFRNKLHFHNSIEFSISTQKIEMFKKLKAFVNEIIENRIGINNLI